MVGLSQGQHRTVGRKMAKQAHLQEKAKHRVDWQITRDRDLWRMASDRLVQQLAKACQMRRTKDKNLSKSGPQGREGVRKEWLASTLFCRS